CERRGQSVRTNSQRPARPDQPARAEVAVLTARPMGRGSVSDKCEHAQRLGAGDSGLAGALESSSPWSVACFVASNVYEMVTSNVFVLPLIRRSITENTETSGSHGLASQDFPDRAFRCFRDIRGYA